MNRQEFARYYIVAIYKVYRRDRDALASIDSLTRYFRLPRDEYLESEMSEHLSYHGWVERVHVDVDHTLDLMRITTNGKIQAEEFIEGGVDPEPLPDVIESDNLQSTETNLVTEINSSSWTGLPSQFVFDQQKQVELIALLNDAEKSLDSLGAGNSEKAMARAYIVAARTLSDVPDPPVDIIWELVTRANALAGIASLFVSIIALFTAAAH